jgi:hypothetical protein
MRIIGSDLGLDGAGVSCFLDGILQRAEGKEFPPEEVPLPRGIESKTAAARAWVKRTRESAVFDKRIQEVVGWVVDRAAHYSYLGLKTTEDPLVDTVIVLEVPPVHTFERTGNKNQWGIQQLRLITGATYDRLIQRGFRVEGIYPLQWKSRFEDAEATVRRIKQAVVLGAIPATPGLEIAKTPGDLWSAVGIGWSVASRRECEGRVG